MRRHVWSRRYVKMWKDWGIVIKSIMQIVIHYRKSVHRKKEKEMIPKYDNEFFN